MARRPPDLRRPGEQHGLDGFAFRPFIFEDRQQLPFLVRSEVELLVEGCEFLGGFACLASGGGLGSYQR